MLARLPFIQRAERMSGSGKVWAALPDGRSLVKEHSGADASREIEPAGAARGTARFGGGGCLKGNWPSLFSPTSPDASAKEQGVFLYFALSIAAFPAIPTASPSSSDSAQMTRGPWCPLAEIDPSRTSGAPTILAAVLCGNQAVAAGRMSCWRLSLEMPSVLPI